MREIMVSQLSGKGVEIGAAANPLPILLHCNVLYADREDSTEIGSTSYPGQNLVDMVPVSIHTSLEELNGIADESIDFLIACHVIEHTSNPIEAIRQAYSRLVHGGQLALVTPDMQRTFDKERDLTELAHLIYCGVAKPTDPAGGTKTWRKSSCRSERRHLMIDQHLRQRYPILRHGI